MQIVMSWGFNSDGFHNYYQIPETFFDIDPRKFVTGTLLILFDSIILIFLFEQISRLVHFLFLRIFLTMAIVLSLHAFIWAGGAFAGTPRFQQVLISGLVSKILPLFTYSALFWMYLVFIEKRLTPKMDSLGQLSDLFNLLTYRQKYELIVKDRETQRLARVESEKKYISLFSSSHAAVLIIDPWSGSIVDANPAAEKFYGWSIDKLKSKFIFEINTAEQVDIKLNIQLARSSQQERFLVQHQVANGQNRDVEVYSGPIIIEGTTYLYAIIHDISDQKKIEEDLRTSEAKLKDAQLLAKIGDFTWDVTTGEVTFSHGMYELLKYDKQEVFDMDKVNAAIHHPDDLESVNQWFSACLDSGKDKLSPKEYRLIRKDGLVINVHSEGIIKYLDGKPKYVFGMCRDITERIQAEEAIRAGEEQNRTIVENSFEGIGIIDDHYRFTYANKNLCKIFGYPPEEVVGANFKKFLAPDDLKLVADNYKRRQGGENIPSRYEIHLLKKNGERCIAELSASIIKPKAGRVQTLVQLIDITERKLARQALRKSNERFRKLFNHSPVPLWEEDY